MSSPRLHIVTGKGGTGKTTVAAALALALASQASAAGREGRVLLAEVEGRQALAQLFDVPPMGAEPVPLAVAPGGGEVFGLAVDVEQAFLGYLSRMMTGLRRTRPLLRRFGVVEFATQVMPGLRDLLLLDPVVTETLASSPTGPRWDAVVLDAPPTGRIARFLSVAQEVGSLAKVGGLATQAARMMSTLRSSQTAVHLVALLEPMPVQETQDAAVELAAEDFPLGLVVVNMARSDVPGGLSAPDGTDVDAQRLAAAAKATGLELDDATLAGLLEEAADHEQRVLLEADERIALDEVGRPVVELPRLADEVELGGLYHLADLLRPALQAVEG